MEKYFLVMKEGFNESETIFKCCNVTFLWCSQTAILLLLFRWSGGRRSRFSVLGLSNGICSLNDANINSISFLCGFKLVDVKLNFIPDLGSVTKITIGCVQRNGQL